jgi:hypothetical protein
MEAKIDLARAQSRHPQLVQDVLSTLSERMKKAKLAPPNAADLEWSYQWAVGFGNGGDTFDNCFVALQGALDRRSAAAALCCAPQQPTPRGILPSEIMDLYAKLNEKTEEATTDYVEAFSYTDMRGAQKRGLAVAGYSDRKGNMFLLSKTVGDRTKSPPSLSHVQGNQLIWNGLLRQAAEGRLWQTKEGDTFTYRNKKLTRLTSQEIQNLVAGKAFSFTM